MRVRWYERVQVSDAVGAAVRPGEQVADVLKVVADPSRLRILTLLAAEQLCVCHLQDALGVGQTLVSHHLRVLRDAGLVETEPCGRFIYYRLRPSGLDTAREVLGSLAAAVLHARSGGRIHVRSAGSIPAGQLEPAVVEVMGELGLDLAREFPKPLTDDVVQAADVVVTMGCGDACPVYPGKRYLDWDLPDPQNLPLEEVRRVRDDIDGRVHALLAELVPTAAAP